MSERTRFWNYENRIVAIFFCCVGFVFFDRLIINYLMPFIQQDLHLDNAQIGLLAAALGITWAVSSVVGGRLSDRVPSKRLYLVALMLVFSVASAFQGFVTSFVMLAVLRMVMGLFEGPIIPVTQSVLAMESSPHRRGFNLGFTMNTANGIFGSILAPLVIVALASMIGWRAAFFFTIVPGLVLAFIVLRTMREPRPRVEGTQATAQAQAAGALDGAAGPDPAGASAAAASTGGLGEVLRTRNVLVSILMFSGFMVYLINLQVFSPVFLTNVRELSTGTMSMILSAFGLGTALWGFLVPLLSDRIGRKPTALMFGILSSLAPLSMLVLHHPVLIALSVFLFAAGMGVGGMAMSVIPAESVNPLHAGLAVGLPTGIGELIGGVLNPAITGMLADQHGLWVALAISSGGALLATICALALKETAPRKVGGIIGAPITAQD